MRTFGLYAAVLGLAVLVGCGSRAPNYTEEQVVASAPRPNLYPLTAPPSGSAQPLQGYAPTRISAVSTAYGPDMADRDPYAAQAAVRTGVGPYTGGTYTTNAFAGYEPPAQAPVVSSGYAAPTPASGYVNAPAVYTPPANSAGYADPFAGATPGGFTTTTGGYCTVEEMRAGMDPRVPITDPPVMVNGRPAASAAPAVYAPAYQPAPNPVSSGAYAARPRPAPSMSLSAMSVVPPGGRAQGNLIYGPVEGTADIITPVPNAVGFQTPVPSVGSYPTRGPVYPPMTSAPVGPGAMYQPPRTTSMPPVVTGPSTLSAAPTSSSAAPTGTTTASAPNLGPSRYGQGGGSAYPALLSSAATVPATARASDEGMPTPARVTTAAANSGEYRLVPALDVPPAYHDGDFAPSQWFEVVRPNNEAVRIGRISSTCTCVGVRIPKRFYAAGERILIEARTVAKPARNNLVYGIYVNILEPARIVVDADVTITV